MRRLPLSVTIITLNEESNIRDALASVSFAEEVILVDSGSTDRTLSIAKEMGAKVFSHPWQGYGHQKNFAQAQAQNSWVLNIDADERVSPELAERLESLCISGSSIAAYAIARKSFYLGRWILHGGWYPNYTLRLYQRNLCRWTEPEVHETLTFEGASQNIDEPLLHYPFHNLQDQVKANLRYSHLGYRELKKKRGSASLFKLCLKPLWKFIECYWIKLGFLDGMAGFIIAINAAHSVFLKYAYFYEENSHHR